MTVDAGMVILGAVIGVAIYVGVVILWSGWYGRRHR